MADGVAIETQGGIQPRNILRRFHEASATIQDAYEFACDGVTGAEYEIPGSGIAAIDVGDGMDAVGRHVAATGRIDGSVEIFAAFKAGIFVVHSPEIVLFDDIGAPFR